MSALTRFRPKSAQAAGIVPGPSLAPLRSGRTHDVPVAPDLGQRFSRMRAACPIHKEMTMRTFIGAALVAMLVALPASATFAQSDKPAAATKPALNLNTATQDQLEELPGIGRATAQRIIEYRQKSGGFKKVEELMNVKGIGEKSFLRLKPLISVPVKTEKPAGEQ
jgi:competence protein ComEA